MLTKEKLSTTTQVKIKTVLMKIGVKLISLWLGAIIFKSTKDNIPRLNHTIK
jgi:hypothetical protein